MKKRALAGLLWFYVTWYAWSFIATAFGLSELWGPVVGAAVAMFIAGDPLGRIWNRGPIGRPEIAIAGSQAEPA